MSDSIVIVGAGITGLYTGLALVLKGVSGGDITYYSEHLPGDLSMYYASPIAGANFSTVSGDDETSLRHDMLTYTMIPKLMARFGAENMGVDFRPAKNYYQGSLRPSAKKMENWKTYVKDFHYDEKTGYFSYTALNFNSPKFCKFIQDFLASQGVTFIRRKLEHIREAYGANTKAVFNCTALGARSLGGVKDDKMYPIRGAVVLVHAPDVNENCMLGDDASSTYMIPRPYSGGAVICGGYFQPHNETWNVYGYETNNIMERIMRTPLFKGKPKPMIMREISGLRPYREGGVRIEKEDFEGKTLIHLVGAGGYGYQSGYGMALDAIALLGEYKTKSML